VTATGRGSEEEEPPEDINLSQEKTKPASYCTVQYEYQYRIGRLNDARTLDSGVLE
jgi:hypothetical protein